MKNHSETGHGINVCNLKKTIDTCKRFGSYYAPSNSEITIYNLLGEPVIRKNMIETNIKLDVSKLIAGIYLVKIETGTNVYSRKFVKQ